MGDCSCFKNILNLQLWKILFPNLGTFLSVALENPPSWIWKGAHPCIWKTLQCRLRRTPVLSLETTPLPALGNTPSYAAGNTPFRTVKKYSAWGSRKCNIRKSFHPKIWNTHRPWLQSPPPLNLEGSATSSAGLEPSGVLVNV